MLKEAIINDQVSVIDACIVVAHQTGDVNWSLVRLRVCWLDYSDNRNDIKECTDDPRPRIMFATNKA